MIRLCVSGIAWCSGLNPCEQCSLLVMGRVLPHAMIAAGFNNDPDVARAFIDTYRRAFRDVQAEAMAAIQAHMVSEQARMQEEQKRLAALAAASAPAPAATEMPQGVGASHVGGQGEVGGLGRDGARVGLAPGQVPVVEAETARGPTGMGIAPPTSDTTQPTTTSLTETLPLPEPPADTMPPIEAAPAAPLPLPMVEGLDNLTEEETEKSDPDEEVAPPSSDTVIAAKRRRGLPRIARGPKRKPSTKAASK